PDVCSSDLDDPHAAPELGVGLQVDPLGGVGVDHAVVGGDVQRRVGRQRAGDLLDQPVHLPQVDTPVVGGDPEPVPVAVEVGVVGEDQGALAPGQRRRGAHRDRGEVVGRQVAAAARGGPGEPAVLVGGGGDVAGGHPGAFGALVGGGQRLPLLGVDPALLAPAELVEDGVGTGDDDLVADDAVVAGARGGAEGGEAGRGGGGEGRGERGARRRGVDQRGQERCVLPVGQQQLP